MPACARVQMKGKAASNSHSGSDLRGHGAGGRRPVTTLCQTGAAKAHRGGVACLCDPLYGQSVE